MKNINNSGDGTFVAKKNKNLNILAFIGCVVLAFIIWIYVMNVKINDNSKTFTIKLDIRGESTLLNDKNYSIFGSSELFVKVTVQGTIAELNKCSEKDFGVYIDVSDIENPGMSPINIVVENQRNSVTVVSTDPVQTTVFVDERVNDKEVPLYADVADGVLSEDQSLIISSDIIRVSGPKTYLNDISYAKVFVDSLTLAEGEQTTAYKSSFPILFYDVTDKVVQSPYLVYNSGEISIEVAKMVDSESTEIIG